ncbi:hypothetical protein AB0E69_19100 [Kribbella sp. NPDC026611]|uniref:hypothetical protein n=1 Tax=Kribbella sp. NPDC026611 TaxID=3154911 RepID=UPI00340E24D1
MTSQAPPTKVPATRPSVPVKPVLTGPGTYTFQYQGATGSIQIPANILDPRLQRYGDYRRLAHARPITYLIAQVNNRSEETITMYEVVVVTATGQQIEATGISDYIDTWSETFAGDDADLDKYTRGLKLSNASQFQLLPGAKGTAFLGAKEPITSVQRVFVYPAGPFVRVEARRVK